MSQHDYNIANGGGAAVRADLNNALLAVLSQNSGATAPTTTKPFMFWYDTTTGVLKMRNAADTAWIAAIDGVTGSNPQGMKNRIINGGMVIDQRNAGASVSTNGSYSADRFQLSLTAAIGSTFTAQQSSTVPSGFLKSLLWTVGTAGTATGTQSARFDQQIEGYNVADFGFGAAGASSFTLSFWVRSSVTGTYCVFLCNSALDRSYVAEYTISSANTWEQKTITVAGDVSGTWLKDNSTGLRVGWDLGSGSSRNTTAGAWASGFYTRTSSQTNFIGNAGATFYITGVQLEKGSAATSFDYRPYGAELALCQRYFEKTYDISNALGSTSIAGRTVSRGSSQGGNSAGSTFSFKVEKRSAPGITLYQSGTGSSGTWDYTRSGASGGASPSATDIATSGFRIDMSVGAAWVAVEIVGHWAASAEL